MDIFITAQGIYTMYMSSLSTARGNSEYKDESTTETTRDKPPEITDKQE